MKFNLTITDMNEEEFAKVFKAVHVPTGNNVVSEPVEVTEASDETINFDIDNLPWDARIHSSNHKINSDGRWQRRRGVSDDDFNKVKNELLGVPNIIAPAPVEAPVVAPVQLAVDNQFAPQVIAPEPTPVVAPAPIAPTTQTPAPVAPVVPEINADLLYQTMFKKLQAGLGNSTLKGNDIKNLLDSTNAQFGLQCQNMTQFKDNIPAIQYIINDLTVRGL